MFLLYITIYNFLLYDLNKLTHKMLTYYMKEKLKTMYKFLIFIIC